MTDAFIGRSVTDLNFAPIDLDCLLAPVGRESFVREFWEKTPWVAARNNPAYFAGLLTLEDVDSLITLAYCSSSQNVRLAKSDNGELKTRSVPANADGVPNIYPVYRAFHDEGYTVTVDRVDTHWKPVATLCRNIENMLHHPAAANLYLTPPKAQGFLPHFDTHDVFILQLAGTKTWRLYDSPVLLPLADESSTLHEERLGEPRQTVELSAGDLLYLPRGHVHEAATTNGPSLHLTIGIHVFRWLDLMLDCLKLAAGRDAQLREAVPAGFLTRKDFGDYAPKRVAALATLLGDSGDTKRSVERLAQRILTNGQPIPDGHFAVLERISQLRGGSKVAHRPGMNCRIVADDEKVLIYFPGNIVSGPTAIIPAVEFIARSDSFLVRDVPGLDGPDQVLLVSRLVREGLLTILPDRSFDGER